MTAHPVPAARIRFDPETWNLHLSIEVDGPRAYVTCRKCGAVVVDHHTGGEVFVSHRCVPAAAASAR